MSRLTIPAVASLGYVPVNRAGDAMTGALVLNTGTDAGLSLVRGAFADSVYLSASRVLNFVKTSGALGGSANTIFRFGTVGAVDADNAFWNAFQLSGPSITDGGVTRVPQLSAFGRAATATDPTDYEFLFLLGSLGALTGRVSFGAPLVANSFVRFGFGSTGITVEALRATYDGTTARTVLGSGGTGIAKHLSAAGALTFSSIAAQATGEQTITVTGAATGDHVEVSPNGSLQAGLVWSAYVSAANTVTVRVANVTTAALTPTNRTWRAAVWQY